MEAAEAAEEGEDQEVNDMLANMGIANPVTKKGAKTASAYHQQLAQELAGFFSGKLRSSGMELSGVYCVYNRARGTDLVSPKDLLEACRLLEGLRLPLRLRRFESGVLTLEDAAGSDDKVLRCIEQGIAGEAYLTAIKLSAMLGVSLVLAKEYLWMAEAQGVACRDDSAQGVRYYANYWRPAS